MSDLTLLYRAKSVPEALAVQSLLGKFGIVSRIPSPEIGGGYAELIPRPDFPRVHVYVEDTETDLAAETVERDARSPAVSATAWTCPQCGAGVDEGFEVCWSCRRELQAGDASPIDTAAINANAELPDATQTSAPPLQPDEAGVYNAEPIPYAAVDAVAASPEQTECHDLDAEKETLRSARRRLIGGWLLTGFKLELTLFLAPLVVTGLFAAYREANNVAELREQHGLPSLGQTTCIQILSCLSIVCQIALWFTVARFFESALF